MVNVISYLNTLSLDHLWFPDTGGYILTNSMNGWWFGKCTRLLLLRGFPNVFVGEWDK